jgi:hypothetical protein
MRKTNKQKRAGMNIWQILAGLGLAAVVGGVVGPRLLNSDLPGIKSNVKTEINSVAEVIDQYLANNNADASGIGWNVLKTSGTVNGSMATAVKAGADATLGTFDDVYEPAWADGKLKIFLQEASGTDKEKVNVIVEYSGDNIEEIEAEIVRHAGVKFGETAVKGDQSSTAFTATPIAPVTAGAGVANTDGFILFTVQ